MFPCLTLVGTSPIFYKITVTAALSQAVQTGTFPGIETRVLCYIPVLPHRNSEGMRPLPNRLEISRCLEAFKKLWEINTGVFCCKSVSTSSNLLVLFTGGDEQAMK